MVQRFGIALIAALCMPAAALAQVKAGGEFRANTYTTGFQGVTAVAPAGDGFVAVWQSSGQDGAGEGIFGRRFDASGAPLGIEFQVNTYTTHWQTLPAVAADAKGNFVVVWTSANQDGSDAILDYGVFGQRFSAQGARLGAEFRVNSYTTGEQSLEAIAMGSAGNFVVVWTSFAQDGDVFGVFGQRFSPSGTPLGGEFQVSAFTTGQQDGPAVAADAAGNFVVVWQTFLTAADGIFGQRFSAAGARLGDEFRVNPNFTFLPAVAADPNGNFVVVWEDDFLDSFDVFGQRFDASGAPQEASFRVNSYTTGDQEIPTIAADQAGDFVVTWVSLGQDGSNAGVFAQRFDAAAARRGAESRVNTYTTGEQIFSSSASDAVGNFVVLWDSKVQDGGGTGAYGQRFGGLAPAALAVDPGGNGVLEPGESVDVKPSWRNTNGAAQTFGGAAIAFTGPTPATYTIEDGLAAYGTVADGATAACGDCYRVSVPTTTRPTFHWDSVLEERLTPDDLGQDKLWRLHLGPTFSDVPPSSGFYRFVETLLHHGITGGCGDTRYCPAGSTSREQMAVFVLVANEGAANPPPACTTPVFADVPANSPFCRWIEELARRGVVAGCGGGNYCPSAAVTREQMAVFVLRTLDPTLVPPACGTPVFADVPASSAFCRWIEELARRGVVAGCGGGNYCPSAAVTREQMGAFIAATFGLTLYGP